MHFSEDDLRAALRRKDPGPGFTQRVMARVSQKQETETKMPPPKKKLPGRGWTGKLRPALIGALAVAVLLIGGMGYQKYERIQERRLEARKMADRQAREAEQKVFLALSITSAKLNHVFQRVNESSAPEPKIRRQSL